MKMKMLPALGGAAMMLLFHQPAQAAVIATIDGAYDSSCNEDPVCSNYVNVLGYTFANNYGLGSPGEVAGDTPSIYIINSSGYALTGLVLTGKGYQGQNNGITEKDLQLPSTIAANTVYQLVWNQANSEPCDVAHGELFANDYDDQYGCTSSAQPGNVGLTLTGTLSGGPNAGPIFSVFSPSSNYSGSFVGFEGVDENGYAESAWDAHSGTEVGTLAVIQTGTVPSVPEPGTLTLFGAALASLGAIRRRRKAT